MRNKLLSRKTITTAVVLLVLLVVTVLVIQKTINSTLTAEQISKKFGCNRITADVRKTDVFCGNPKFYNNPDSVTYDDYYKWLGCATRLSGEPPTERESGIYEAYYNCNDRSKLESLRKEFIIELKKLKSENG